MKKVLEDELMSLAHRILKLRNRADIHELKEETALLYEKLSILSFVEKHFDGVKPTIKKYEIEKSIQQEFNLEHTKNLNYPDGTEYNEDAIYEHNTEKIKDIVSQMPFEAQVVDHLFEELKKKEKKTDPPKENSKSETTAFEIKDDDSTKSERKEEPPKEPGANDKKDELKEDPNKNSSADDKKAKDPVEVEDFGVHFDDLPDFEPASEGKDSKDVPKENPEQKENEEPKHENVKEVKNDKTEAKTKMTDEEKKPQRTMDLFSQNKKSLNDKLNKDLKIGLNDRLSFVNHLFKGDSKTYESFIGNINAMNSLDEVKEFLNEQIQDKYDYWKDKEEIANRLLQLIEKKFE